MTAQAMIRMCFDHRLRTGNREAAARLTGKIKFSGEETPVRGESKT
ncbi:hypothetical protein CLOM621_08760 [Clostridium sp. M62/1]|nr:hypothetical protein CLOM621_08760 [Clostridium sp. M62/1]